MPKDLLDERLLITMLVLAFILWVFRTRRVGGPSVDTTARPEGANALVDNKLSMYPSRPQTLEDMADQVIAWKREGR
jgi:hypothetical protein